MEEFALGTFIPDALPCKSVSSQLPFYFTQAQTEIKLRSSEINLWHLSTSFKSMDLNEELERIIQEMEWSDVLDSLQVVVDEILGEEPNTLSPPPPPPAEKGINIHPQPVEMLQYNNEHVSRLPQVMEDNLVPVGTV